MTKEEANTLRFRVGIFAQLTNGGHMQVRVNDQYGFAIIDKKQDRNSQWKRTFAVGVDTKTCRGISEGLTLEEFLEAIKDIPFRKEEDGDEGEEQPE